MSFTVQDDLLNGVKPVSASALWEAECVAVVGATESEGKAGYRVLRNLIEFGYKGTIYPINPRLDECQGLKCYRTLSDLPEAPDLVAIVLAASLVPTAMKQAADIGARATLIISSGFGESGKDGQKLQDEIAAMAESRGMVLCGPNSVGFIRTQNNLALTFTEALSRGKLAEGKIGMVSQSGAFGTVLYAQARDRKLGINTYVSSGNEATLNFGHYAAALTEDPTIDVVGGYLEGLRDSNSLYEAAQRALELKKPLVVLKVGRSDSGSSAAASHTGALVGNDEAYRAAFEEMGIIQVEDEKQLLDSMDVLSTYPEKTNGDRVMIISMSGGAGVLMSDLLEEKGQRLATTSPELESQLKELLPKFASVQNPVDVTGQFVTDPKGIDLVIETAAHDPGVDIVVVYIGLAWSQPEVWKEALRSASRAGKPIIVGAPMMTQDSSFTEELRQSGIITRQGTRQVVEAVQTLNKWRVLLETTEDELKQKQMKRLGRSSNKQTLGVNQPSEAFLKKTLQDTGIKVPEGRLVTTPAEAAEFASQHTSPFVLKVQAEGLYHKSDVGGVKLNIETESVPRAVEDLYAAMKLRGLEITGVYIEEMITRGLELMVGAVESPPFGLLMAVGVGGVDVEIKPEMEYAIPPLSSEEARRLVHRLSVYPKLAGHRGDPGYDTAALEEFIEAFSEWLVVHQNEIIEIDLNPISVQRAGGGVVVLDAMASIRASSNQH